MVYSERFKSRIVGKMVGANAVSAIARSGEVGIHQTTLSRWLREAHTVPGMAKKSRRSKKETQRRPQDWSPEEKLRVVVESGGLDDVIPLQCLSSLILCQILASHEWLDWRIR